MRFVGNRQEPEEEPVKVEWLPVPISEMRKHLDEAMEFFRRSMIEALKIEPRKHD